MDVSTGGGQQVLFTNSPDECLRTVVEAMRPNRVFVVADVNTVQCVSRIASACADVEPLVLPDGDSHKNMDALQRVWQYLEAGGATRQSVVVNVGGGMITDLGGFAAATFKRGIRFVNVPTTVLGAVDAAVGGKTGINYNGLKNEIGTFCEADAVIVSACFYDTLPDSEFRSGYAEMIKHGLIEGEAAFNRLLDFNISDVPAEGQEKMLHLLEESVGVKQRIVAIDPFEHGLRRVLNLGHTFGHAFESLSIEQGHPVPHGYAVAWGLVAEAVVSRMLLHGESRTMYRLADYVYQNYGAFRITCEDYGRLLELMRHDKKSRAGEFNFSLIASPGDIRPGCVADKQTVESALDIFRDLMHV